MVVICHNLPQLDTARGAHMTTHCMAAMLSTFMDRGTICTQISYMVNI